MSTTTAPVKSATTPDDEEWIDPKKLEHKFSINRNQMYQLVAERKITSCSVKKKKNAKRGHRLIEVQSVREHLLDLAAEQGTVRQSILNAYGTNPQ